MKIFRKQHEPSIRLWASFEGHFGPCSSIGSQIKSDRDNHFDSKLLGCIGPQKQAKGTYKSFWSSCEPCWRSTRFLTT